MRGSGIGGGVLPGSVIHDSSTDSAGKTSVAMQGSSELEVKEVEITSVERRIEQPEGVVRLAAER